MERGAAVVPEPGTRQGSSVALGRRKAGLVAYVADRDRSRLVAVDVTEQRMIGTVDVLGAPEQVVILRDGRVVASVGSGRHVEVFEPVDVKSMAQGTPLRRLCAREVPAGPFGLAVSPDESTLVVTSAWEPALTLVRHDLRAAVHHGRCRGRRAGSSWTRATGRSSPTSSGGALSVVSLDSPSAAPFSIPLGVRAGSPAGKEASLRLMRKDPRPTRSPASWCPLGARPRSPIRSRSRRAWWCRWSAWIPVIRSGPPSSTTVLPRSRASPSRRRWR